ncbi:DUF739 family protein [Helcococcus sueciensis]|uniref:DUF739 family protein n=1 Tax=Helcococcus sueciensis TaxID=241555 RepID=UPI00040193D9|nr:DUF739 family protein [Helcococcus sueciensis]
MYNLNKLKGRIIEKFGTQGNFAKAMGMSERTVSLKLDNQVDWKQSEIVKACELLKIPKEEIADYFFTLKVQ